MEDQTLCLSYNPFFPGTVCVQLHFTHDNAVGLLREAVVTYDPEVRLVQVGEVLPQNGMYRSAYYTVKPRCDEDLAEMRQALHDSLTGEAQARYIWPSFELVSQ